MDQQDKFRNEIRYPVSARREDIRRNARTNERGRYTSKQKVKNMPKRISLRVAAALLAAGVGIGGVTVLGHVDTKPSISITQMEQSGKDLSSLGLQDDTMQLMQKYDEIFDDMDLSSLDMTDNNVIDMINEVERLNFNVVKDKIADKIGKERNDVKLYYRFEKGDGKYITSIVVNEGKPDKATYTNAETFMLGIGRKNYIPEKVSDLILQLRDYDGLIQNLKDDKISKVNAIKELRKKYDKITEFATSELEIDQKGNFSVKDFNGENNTIDKEDYQK